MLWSHKLPQNSFASLLPGKLPFMFYFDPRRPDVLQCLGLLPLVLRSASLPLPSSWSDYVDNV